MLHLRVVAPAEVCERVVDAVAGDDAVANVAHIKGTGIEGTGDVVMFDVAREAANPLLDRLRALDVVGAGSISITEAATVLGTASERAERLAPGHPSDGVVWEEVEERAVGDARMSWTFLVFLVLATLIAGVGRYLDQPILIIGAMVVGPEFAPLSAICLALARRKPRLLGPASLTLFGGFAIAIAIAFLLWGAAGLLGLVDPTTATTGELTSFIVSPDAWSFLIALLAGVAGILSITSAKSSALVGVFISITTVPAAATIALTLAVGAWDEALASAIQLGVNLLGLMIGGVATLVVQAVLLRRRRT